MFFKKINVALAGVAQWIYSVSGHQFNSQSRHMPKLQARSPVGGTLGRQPHIDVSLFFSLSKNK